MESELEKIEELVFDSKYSLEKFIKVQQEAKSGPWSVKELIVELGDGPISDEIFKLLEKCFSHISNIDVLNFDIFACHCTDERAIPLLNLVLSSNSE